MKKREGTISKEIVTQCHSLTKAMKMESGGGQSSQSPSLRGSEKGESDGGEGKQRAETRVRHNPGDSGDALILYCVFWLGKQETIYNSG